MTSGTTSSIKIQENRLRRMADRQGFQIVRSRRRDVFAPDFGAVVLKDAYGAVLAGDPLPGTQARRDRLLDDIEGYLTRRR